MQKQLHKGFSVFASVCRKSLTSKVSRCKNWLLWVVKPQEIKCSSFYFRVTQPMVSATLRQTDVPLYSEHTLQSSAEKLALSLEEKCIFYHRKSQCVCRKQLRPQRQFEQWVHGNEWATVNMWAVSPTLHHTPEVWVTGNHPWSTQWHNKITQL